MTIRWKRQRWSTKCTRDWSTSRGLQWRDRAHFLAMAATLMRRILIEFARSRHVQKRGAGQQQRISLTEGIAPTRAGVVRRARPA